MDRLPERKRPQLWWYFTKVIFLTVMASLFLFLLLWLILYRMGAVTTNPFAQRPLPLGALIAGSMVIGGVVALLVSRRIIRPMQKIRDAFDELSRGNFDVRISTDEKFEAMREIAEHFNRMVFDLSHVETLRSEFVEDVSHEFKTPVAAIEGYATLLQNPLLTQEKRDYYVEKIIGNTKKLSSLTGNILLLAKLENQETVLHKKSYRLDEQLRRAVLLLENRWTERGIGFDIDLAQCVFYGNEQLMDQVWFNLIDNAIKHSRQGGSIRIGIEQRPAEVAVSVSDDGEGMDADTQKHIFEKFYQGDASRTSEGNGLGLALVQRIVDLCRGEISVCSEPGKGTSFTVILPNQ